MEALSRRLVLALGVIAVITIGVNLVVFLALFSTYASSTYGLREPLTLTLEKGLSAPSLGENVQAEQQEKTISVTGMGIVKTKPDRAIISLSVVTQADSAERAISENAVKTDNVIKALKAVGIGEDKMETSTYSLNPIWDYSGGSPPRITGYTCSNTIRITVTDLNRIGEVIDDAVSAGANHVSSLQFTVSDEAMRQIGSEALRDAVRDADLKARAVANAAGVTLTGLVSISVLSYSPYTVSYTFESASWPVPAPTPATLTTSILPPEEVSVTVSVSAIYAFR
jgi:uncharacterized protein YggE